MLSFASKAGAMDWAVTLSKIISGKIFGALETSTIFNKGPRFTAARKPYKT